LQNCFPWVAHQRRHCAQSNPPRRRAIARLPPEGAVDPDIDAVTPAVVIGLDGGYLRSRHRRPERNFEVIAGKVLISMELSIASPLPATAIL